MRYKRSLPAMLLAVMLMAGTFIAAPMAVAQEADATPAVDGEVIDNVVVEVIDERGDPYLTIVVEETHDPWEDFAEYSTPDRGFRYVALVVTVENVGNRTEDVTDFDFFLRDEQGFIYGDSYVSLLEDSPSEEIGVFESTDLEPGDSVTGVLVFYVPTEAEIVDAFYAPSGRLITIAVLGGEAITEE